jgi:CRP-like cAMP-binding protein
MLTGHELFRSFLPNEIEEISAFSSARRLDKGQVIYRPDRKATHIFVLLEGEVQLRLPTGHDDTGIVVTRVGHGELFGIAPLLGADGYTTSACCTKASKVMFIEARPLLQMLLANPLAGQQVMAAVARIYFDRYQIMIGRIRKVINELEFAE